MTTNCAFPPELDDEQLLAYLDGEADEATIAHLKGCAHCLARSQALDRLQKRLTSQLYRITCPQPVELGEYHLRLLPASQMMVVGQHVRECPHCAREIGQLEEFFLGDLQPTESSLLGKVKVLIARLLGEGPGESAPAFAALRGDEQEPFIYQADDVRIVIEVQDDVEQMGLKTLLGLVTGLESNEFSIQVSQGGQSIATSSVDEIGNFIISHLSPGHYQLILRGPNIEIHVQSLPVT